MGHRRPECKDRSVYEFGYRSDVSRLDKPNGRPSCFAREPGITGAGSVRHLVCALRTAVAGHDRRRLSNGHSRLTPLSRDVSPGNIILAGYCIDCRARSSVKQVYLDSPNAISESAVGNEKHPAASGCWSAEVMRHAHNNQELER